MATAAELLTSMDASRRRRRSRRRGYPALELADSGGWSRRLWQPFGQVLEGMAWVDEKTRAAAGALTGVEAKDPTAPTGEELLKSWTGLQLPENTKGKIEWRDVPGFATELAVSPFNLLPLGQLSKAGRLAARGTDVAGRARALRAAGLLDDARALRPAMRSIRGQARRLGIPKTLGSTWREQGRLGQRSLIGLDVPTFGIPGLKNLPIAGGGVSLLKAPLALEGLRQTGRAAKAPFARLGPLFRVGGRVNPALTVAAEGGRRLTGKDYNALIGATEDVTRRGRRVGTEQRDAILRGLRGWRPGRAEKTLTGLKKTLPPLARQAVEADPVVKRLARRIERLNKAGDPGGAGQAAGLLARKREQLGRRYDLLPKVERDPRVAALTLGLEQRGVEKQLVALSRQVQKAASEKIARYTEARDLATLAGDAKAAGNAQRQITRTNNTAVEKVNALAARGKLSRTLWDALPNEIQAEAARIATITDDALKLEKQLGVPVGELSDSLLSYMHRSLTPAGWKFAQALEKLGLDSPFTRYGRQFTTNKGFTKRRVAAFEGMGVMQINEWANRFAVELRKDKRLAASLANEGVSPTFGKRGFEEFFAENPAEAVLRRMTSSGQAQGSARMFGGMLERFAVPMHAAGRGAVPIGEFLERAKLRRVGDQALPRGAGSIKASLADTRYAGKAIPREFANQALRVQRTLETPEQLREIAGFFDQYNASMRFWVTVPWAGYHVRNALSNVWMCWLAGMRNPALFGKAAGIQTKATRAAKLGRADPALDLMQRLTDMGAAGGGMTGELQALLATAPSKAVKAKAREGWGRKALRVLGRPGETRGGQQIMRGAGAIENNAKVALYLDGLERGLTEIEAAERVKKFLFDYAALGPADKAIRKWAFFYTFFRKNMPLQIESLATNTRKMHAWAKLGGDLGDSRQEDLLAEYQRARTPLVAGRAGDGSQRFISLGMPYDDLKTISGEGRPGVSGAMRIGQRLWGMGAPLVRALPELLTGNDLSSGQPLVKRNDSLGLSPAARVLLSLTPASRAVTTAARIGDVAEGRRPAEDLLSLLGVTPTRVDPGRAGMRRKLQSVNALLDEMVLRGRARPFKQFGQATRGGRDKRVHDLLRLRRLLESATVRR